MKKGFFLFFSLFFFNEGYSQPIITRESYVDFFVGTIAFGKVEGTLSYIEGSIYFNEMDLENSSFNVGIESNSIYTGNENRDKHLINEDFLDAKNYPNITFYSDHIFAQDSGFIARGNLTIREVTHEIDLFFMVDEDGLTKTFNSYIAIQRLDYNVGVGQKSILVKDTIYLHIHCSIVSSSTND